MSDRPAAARVVVTGAGAVSPLGRGVEALWSGLLAGRSGIRRLEGLDLTGQEVDFGGQVPGFDPSDVLEAKQVKRLDRFSQFAIVAAAEALASAGLPPRLDGAAAEGLATIVGSGLGGATTIFEQAAVYGEKGASRISPFLVPAAIGNMAAGEVAIHVGAQAASFGVVSACATAGHAIGEAYEMIRRGDADRAIAGGAEAAIHPVVIAGFNNMRALSRSGASSRGGDPAAASRPFDAARDGFVMSEGAGLLLLERLDVALARGATPLAEIVGYGATADAQHITLPAPGGAGAVRAARRALAKAGRTGGEIDHVNAHATSTGEGDRAELEAIRTILGGATGATVTASKGALGHTLGAAGGLGAIATICAMRDGRVHHTLNLADPDPAAAGLDIVRGAPREQAVRLALVNAFGFGGQNSALLFARWEDR
ncbi:MAG: beta-ketoacyl-acyl-carrier-protein synthase [Chloroflexota bacterium]|jgi:3-oxoacyl-[acyl-carrier-protein] synthase II